MNFDPAALVQFIQSAGVLGCFCLFVLAIVKGWVVPGAQYRDVIRDRDDWKEIALQGTDATHRALQLAERRRRDAGGTGRGQ